MDSAAKCGKARTLQRYPRCGDANQMQAWAKPRSHSQSTLSLVQLKRHHAEDAGLHGGGRLTLTVVGQCPSLTAPRMRCAK
jgi:hypothetical protein